MRRNGELQNYFCLTLKLKQKERIGAHYYDAPKTPYQCVMDRENVKGNTKSKLRAVHEILNPFNLKQQIDAKLHAIFSYETKDQ